MGGVGNRKGGVGNRKGGARNRKGGVGNGKGRSQKQEKAESETKKGGVGNRKGGVGNRKGGVGNRKGGATKDEKIHNQYKRTPTKMRFCGKADSRKTKKTNKKHQQSIQNSRKFPCGAVCQANQQSPQKG